jgi:hypothetical protein
MISSIIYNLFCKIYHYFVPQKDEFMVLQSMDSLDFEEDAIEIYGGTLVEGSVRPIS